MAAIDLLDAAREPWRAIVGGSPLDRPRGEPAEGYATVTAHFSDDTTAPAPFLVPTGHLETVVASLLNIPELRLLTVALPENADDDETWCACGEPIARPAVVCEGCR